MTNTILVLGATGNVGSQVVQQLAAAGANTRAAVRSPSKALALQGAGVSEILSAVVRRKINYVNVSDDTVSQGMKAAGIPEVLVNAFMELNHIQKADHASGISKAHFLALEFGAVAVLWLELLRVVVFF